MFAGHYAVALACAGRRSAPPLGRLFGAVQLLDVAHSVLVLTGAERVRVDAGTRGTGAVHLVSVPYSHSLPGAIAASVVTGAATLVARRGRPGRRTTALLVTTAVASHWPLDAVVRDGDLPVTGTRTVGWGWSGRSGVAVETLLLAGGLTLYLRRTRPTRPAGRFAVPTLVAGVAALGATAAVTHPPSSRAALAATNLGTYAVLAGLAGWLGSFRTTDQEDDR